MARTMQKPKTGKSREKRSIKHRGPNFQFKSDIPRHWMAGSPFRTHLLNSFTLIFPTGEKYFIRSVQKVLSKITDAELKQDALLFIKQEAQHSLEHEKFFNILKEQNYNFKESIQALDILVKDLLGPMNSDALNLSITAGLEHLTALLAEIGLKEKFLDGAPAELRDLFYWHAGEEIEHRSVAFDVYQNISGNYPLRVAGLVYGYLLLSFLTFYFTSSLCMQDKSLYSSKAWKDFVTTFFTRERLFVKAIFIFVRYLDPDFHPDENSNLDKVLKQSASEFFSERMTAIWKFGKIEDLAAELRDTLNKENKSGMGVA